MKGHSRMSFAMLFRRKMNQRKPVLGGMGENLSVRMVEDANGLEQTQHSC